MSEVPAAPAPSPVTAAVSSPDAGIDPANPPVPAPAKIAKAGPVSEKGGRFFRRRAVWWPTWRIWLPVLLILTGTAYLTERHLHGWLAVTSPVPDARYLAVEGWVTDNVLQEAVNITEDTGAQRIFCTGIPLERGSFIFQFGTYARYAAETMAKMGLDPQRICPVPAPNARRERTRIMAEALRDVLANEPVPDTGRRINLITAGTHARRSRAIFQDVLGPEWQVGVISIPPEDYEPAAWYLQSGGQRAVLSELTALTMRFIGVN